MARNSKDQGTETKRIIHRINQTEAGSLKSEIDKPFPMYISDLSHCYGQISDKKAMKRHSSCHKNEGKKGCFVVQVEWIQSIRLGKG